MNRRRGHGINGSDKELVILSDQPDTFSRQCIFSGSGIVGAGKTAGKITWGRISAGDK
ncbi:hypothetical protein [Desulfogranum japonicum]|uniref:hypothetical protein n=1 Tax=Desulfogranum japonicum TaxID=231447 RepID=UPI0012946795|nr:hypothetical protein [Desulfogranum japonicum]